MAVEDILPTGIVILVIYLLVRWLTSKPSTSGSGQGGIRGVTPSMVETVHSAFPDIPIPNIIYHLSRTRSAQATSETILETGSLPPPPASFNIPALLIPQSTTTATITSINTNNNVKTNNSRHQSLIERYNLSSRVPVPSSKSQEQVIENSQPQPQLDLNNGKEKGQWQDSRDQRESSLRERKEKMILEARRRLLEKEKEKQAQEQSKPQDILTTSGF